MRSWARSTPYAKDVIQDRAIPDARDGLKPVQRRILFDMYNTGNTIDKPTKKCAHIVGDVMGKYHPHGDSRFISPRPHVPRNGLIVIRSLISKATTARSMAMAPPPIVTPKPGCAAFANELLRDIDEDTVKMELTFDDTLLNRMLPARFPNLFVNGSEGIAVGIATSIPPHNLKEVTPRSCYRIKHPNCEIDDLIRTSPARISRPAASSTNPKA
jgi:topoisomerase-4 subunit A